MSRNAVSSVAASLLLLFFLPTGAFATPLVPEAEFMTRFGRADFDAIGDLLFNPTKIDSNLRTWNHEGEKILRSETDVHAIYPYPVGFFVRELLNYENNQNTYPRVTESILEFESDDPFGRHSLSVHIDLKVLGFGAKYTYVTDNWMEKCGEGYLQKYKLSRSPDGTFYQFLGSWYVEEIMYEGTPHTYIRNYAVLGFRRSSLPMEIAIRTFAIWQLRQIFNNIAQAVRNESHL